MSRQTDHLAAILSVIEQTRGSTDQFAETLRHKHIPHLSFSQVSTVEFCHYRYFLQYEALIDPDPIPDYFTKGKLLHQVIARLLESLYGEDASQHAGNLANHYELGGNLPRALGR